MLQDILSPDSIWFVIVLIAFVVLIIAAVILPAYIQHIIIQRKRRKKIFPLPALSYEGKGLTGVVGASAFIWGLIILLLLSSCSPRITALRTEGIIIHSEEDRVFVLFEDALGKPGNYSGNWFYVPGVGIVDRERYKILVTLEEIK